MKKIISFLIAFILLLEPIFLTSYANSDYDFRTESNVTNEQLSGALYHNLSDLSDVFIECEKELNVNAILLCSLAALESGWGKSEIAKEKNNLFGWRNSEGEYREFESKEICITEFSEYISLNYLDDSGKYYSGGTAVEHVAVYYSESQHWEKTICEIYDLIKMRCDEYEEK